MTADATDLQRAAALLGDWRWRLDNLYYITDKDGRETPFRMNWAQEALFTNMHFLCLILKARQLGFSTFILLFMLDVCLFNSNVKCGIIDVKIDDAKKKVDKVKFAYNRLPEPIRQAVKIKTANVTTIEFENGSSIEVGTSHRGGTLQYLHISEFGKICAKFPDKAREIRTGALNTIQAGQVAFIESTAEGQEGDFFDLCQGAQGKARAGTRLTPLDFKFFFYPWWKAPEYRIDPTGVPIPDDMLRYFAKLAEQGIELDAAQKAWYVKKAETQLADMKREYPSTPKEAFEASVEGAYYGELMEAAEARGRIGEFKAVPGVAVNTAWDIGHSDYTSIWFWQRLFKKVRLVGYYQNVGEGAPHYAQEVQKLYLANNWARPREALDIFPHDARVTEWGSAKSRIEQLIELGFRPTIATNMGLDDGINAARATIPICEFDAEACSEGIKALKNYRKEWNEELARWRDKPFHNWASDGADAYRYMAIMQREQKEPERDAPVAKKELTYTVDPKTGVISSNITITDMIKQLERKARRGR